MISERIVREADEKAQNNRTQYLVWEIEILQSSHFKSENYLADVNWSSCGLKW